MYYSDYERNEKIFSITIILSRKKLLIYRRCKHVSFLIHRILVGMFIFPKSIPEWDVFYFTFIIKSYTSKFLHIFFL